MRFDEATLAQNRASSPIASTWLSANAGSGKTKVLTDRVARLLLRGVEPQRILCLTYTKAAASEMQNRLFALLGKWAMLPENQLRDALWQIDEGPGSGLAEARRLFARAIEAPGGLKIQTIHSFCASLLRRFPLEAGLSPAFTEMDDRSARILRSEVLDIMALGDARPQFDGLAALFTGAELDTLLVEICANASGFSGQIPEAELRVALGLREGYTLDTLLAEVFLGSEFSLFDAIVPVLAQGGKKDVEAAQKLQALRAGEPDIATLEGLEDLLLFKSGQRAFQAKIDEFPNKATRTALGTLMDPLNQLMMRVETARHRRLALAAFERAMVLHQFARAFLPEYSRAKAARAWLDFDDLIARAGQLLTDPSVAQWVLFKLDGGVDHILVDEAQDTSPGQWRVIEQLAQEFTAGVGARDASRTLFVVGDKKQSIYSFQGADLQVFDEMQTLFRTRLGHVDLSLNEALLAHSFRSSDAILRTVDATFRPPHESGLGGAPQHIAFNDALPGRVDLWPAIARPDTPSKPEWFDPVDVLPEEHHQRQLARMIAQELRKMIDAKIAMPRREGAEPFNEGDVLILVRRRNTLFHEIIAACKAQGLEIAGADRLRLGAEMAVRDLTAFLAFLATPEDDLSLAACLRSPLFGWSEDALFRLAHGRGNSFLWSKLRSSDESATLDVLNDMRRQTDFLRPYDLIERLLTRHEGRRRLIARLGIEAEDGIDAFLAQALAYEQLETPSLTGFLGWLEQGDVQIKRELDSAGGRLRVMTVHGAKGLEAPVVILPDTAEYTPAERRQIFNIDAGLCWRGDKASTPDIVQDAVAQAAELRAQEDARLLYVAMTRAESWLIVAGAGAVSAPDCWYNRIKEGLEHVGATEAEFPTGSGLRFQHLDWPVQSGSTAPLVSVPAGRTPPDMLWQHAPAPHDRPRAISPSDLGGAKALAGEAGEEIEDALLRGTALHLLLEHLPVWPRENWQENARALLATLDGGMLLNISTVIDEAARVLDEPALAQLFAPGTLAEVEISATFRGRALFGVIDRLIVQDDTVLAVDFKSNRLVPRDAADVPEGLLRQMAAYQHGLGQVFPGRHIRVALLWTAQAEIMELPDPLLKAALHRAELESSAARA
ncbi:MAG: double-strand break repair helicase AddA [Roseinatronobacter sp.]